MVISEKIWEKIYYLFSASTSRKVAGSIQGEIIGFLNLPDPSSSTMSLGSTQPLTEISTRNISGVKDGLLARKTNNLTANSEPTV
jgi:hypothetical protein